MNQKLTATQGLTYGGKWRKEGDTFEASGADARVLIAIGKCKPYKVETKPETKPPTVKVKDLRAVEDIDAKPGTYSRRDMQAK